MKMLVGLGNPGEKYLLTPHNIGWIVMDSLAHHLNIQWHSKKKFSSQIAFTEQQKNLLVKPLTYMNLSGVAVKNVMNYYHLNLDNLLVIHDDIDLPFLSLRFQKNRGPAGHNGLQNINKELESQDYARLRIGMRPPEKQDTQNAIPSSFSAISLVGDINIHPAETPSSAGQIQVLKPFTKTEQDLLSDFLSSVIEAIQYFITEGLEKTANRYNS